jgi:hypothetical protein
MDLFIKNAQGVVEMDAVHVSSVELFVMCIQCMEVSLSLEQYKIIHNLTQFRRYFLPTLINSDLNFFYHAGCSQ